MNLIFGLLLVFQVPTYAQHKLLWESKARFYKAFKNLTYEDTLHNFDVIHYGIHVRLDIPNESIYAYNEVQFRSKIDNLNSIFLHLIGYQIDSIAGANSYSRDDSVLNINLQTPLNANDTGEVTIYYHGHAQTGGGVFGGGLHFYNSGHLVFIDDEPYGAKRWVPIYDLPSDKATVDQYITVPNGYTVVANGSLVDSTLNNDNTVTFHWRERYQIANYLIVFAASDQFAILRDSAIIDGEVLPILNYFEASDTARLRPKFARTPDMLEFLSQIYGTYPYMGEKYGHVSTPIGGAMENQTNTFINTRANWGTNWDWVIVHEMGHQWWGDWVTLGTWADIWLNEGFATYTEVLWSEHRYGNSGLRAYMTQIFQEYLNYEPYPPYPIYNPNYMWGVVVYQKGASVLHMLRYIVGDSTFFQILRAYGEMYAYGNAVTSEFMHVVDSISGQNLDWFFDEWVFAPGHPIYRYSYTSYPVSDDTFGVDITVDQIQSHSYGVPTYKMPIQFKIATNQGVSYITVWDSLDHQTFTVFVEGHPSTIIFDPNQWILEEHTFLGSSETPGMLKDLDLVSNAGKDFVQFSIPLSKDAKFRIYDVSGRLIKSVLLRKGTSRLNISSLKTGFYFVIGDNFKGEFLKY